MEVTPRVLATLGVMFLALGTCVMLSGSSQYYYGSLRAQQYQEKRPVVMLTFEGGRLDTSSNAAKYLVAEALQSTIDDARSLHMRLGAASRSQVLVTSAMQFGDTTMFQVVLSGIPPSHMRAIEALAIGRPLGQETHTATLPPTSHLARRLKQQGITAPRITWQTFYIPAPPTNMVIPSIDAPLLDSGIMDPQESTDPADALQNQILLMDDDVEQLALLHALQARQPSAGYQESARRAQQANPIFVGGRAGAWSQPGRDVQVVDQPEDQELAASRQVVAGGAGSVLVANPFPLERPDEDAIVQHAMDAGSGAEAGMHAHLATLWNRIHTTWDNAARGNTWQDEGVGTAEEVDAPLVDDAVPATPFRTFDTAMPVDYPQVHTKPVTTLDALVVPDATPRTLINKGHAVIGMDVPQGVDSAAVDRLADWEPYRTEVGAVAPADDTAAMGPTQPHGLLVLGQQGRLLLHKLHAMVVNGIFGQVNPSEAMPVRHGRRLAEVNWPLTGTGIGLGGVGVILLSAAVGAICSRWCLARRERQAKKHDLHTRFPLGSHFYEMPTFLGGSSDPHALQHGGKPRAHHDVLAHQQAMLREAELARAGLYNHDPAMKGGLLATPATFGKPNAPPSLARPSACSVASAGHAGSVFSSFTAAPSMFGGRAPQGPVLGTPQTQESAHSLDSNWQHMPVWIHHGQEDGGAYTPRYMSSAGGESLATPPYTPGSNPYTPGSNPYTPGSNPYTPGSHPYTPGSHPYTPGSHPYTPGSQPPSRSMSPLRGASPMGGDTMSLVSGGTMEGSAVFYPHPAADSLLAVGRQTSFVGYAAGPAVAQSPVLGSPAHNVLSMPAGGVQAPVGRVFDPNTSRPIFGQTTAEDTSTQGGSGVNISLASSQS